ncbi:HAMP domain-containing protein, partial [Streptomyces sp. NPDC050848]|uniref:HAMP domain-containing protein n=1 Tax=Streptomyces sp. NPDC050848 TaxID=3155791 RepID=UPI0034095202
MALGLSSLGAWWMCQDVYATQLAASSRQAEIQARAASDELTAGNALGEPAKSPETDLPVFILENAHATLLPTGLGMAWPTIATHLYPSPATASAHWATETSVRLAQPDGPDCTVEPKPDRTVRDDADACRTLAAPFAGRDVALVGMSTIVPSRHSMGVAPGRYTIYAAVSPAQAEAATRALTPALFVAVPATAAAVAVAAWTATSRALRPVDRIRSRLARITPSTLGSRVPVPAADDEIGRLARTTNDTLDAL